MKRFEICIPRILKHEGGFVDHPRDPGGATNKGITIATFRRYIKPTATVADLKAMTQEQAVLIYKRHYWDAVSADRLPPGLDYAVADFAVNSGPFRAAQYLQRILGVSADGRIGPATLAAARAGNAASLVNRLCDDRLAFMRRIKGGDGRLLWDSFGRGWQRRVDDVRKDALADARAPIPVLDAQPPATGAASPWAAIWRLLAGIFKGGKA
jgi:lysozyme family protein